MKIIAIIVTYNRLELLKQSIDAVLAQTVKPESLIVIDNNSTDGTKEFLDNFKDDALKAIHLEENIGGAGGFSYGIKMAVREGCDWVWIMDDDTIPERNALEELTYVAQKNPDAGYLSSRALWTDGDMHVMNCQWMPNKKVINKNTPIDTPLRIKSASFVSLMINAKAIMEVGLPYKEFFIWCDDSEYTSRIFEAGYPCYYVGKSVVIHKTATNYMPSLADAPKETAWKFYYNMRNNVFLRRKKYKNSIIAFVKILNYYRLELRHLNKRPSADRNIFKKELKKGFWDGLKFNAEVEMA